jgi:hypothetical protein
VDIHPPIKAQRLSVLIETYTLLMFKKILLEAVTTGGVNQINFQDICQILIITGRAKKIILFVANNFVNDRVAMYVFSLCLVAFSLKNSIARFLSFHTFIFLHKLTQMFPDLNSIYFRIS